MAEKNFNELYENYLLNKTESDSYDKYVNFQNSIFDLYKKSDKSESVQNEILSIIEKCMKEENSHDYMWRVFFESDRKMNRKIDLLECKVMAEKSFEGNTKSPHPVLLEQSASLAFSICENKETQILDSEKVQIWLKTFESIPEFKIAFEEETQYWKNWRAELYKKYQPTPKEEQVVVESYEIFIPALLPKKYNDYVAQLWSSPEVDTLVNEIVSDFNTFHLHGYMKSLENKCVNSSVEFYNGFFFKFNCSEQLSFEHLNQVKEELLGQLSDGWGENASQRKILIGDKEVSIDFAIDEAKDFHVIKDNNNSSKPKI